MRINLTAKAQELASEFFGENRPMYAIDATLGNGFDALFLSKLINGNGKIFGFDVQEMAIESSKKLFAEKNPNSNYEFFKVGHESMQECIAPELIGKIGCVFFNLGWLPRSDKSVATKSDTTLKALETSVKLIDKNAGYLSVLCYRGHQGGAEEYSAVLDFFQKNFADKFISITNEANEISPVILAMKFSANNF